MSYLYTYYVLQSVAYIFVDQVNYLTQSYETSSENTPFSITSLLISSQLNLQMQLYIYNSIYYSLTKIITYVIDRCMSSKRSNFRRKHETTSTVIYVYMNIVIPPKTLVQGKPLFFPPSFVSPWLPYHLS